MPQASGDIVNLRVVVAGSLTKQTTVVTKFGQFPPILSEDGTKLTLLFTKCDGSLVHNGVNLRVDTPITDLALANVNDKTAAYLNDGIEIPINFARMPKLRTIEVKYFVGAGTAQSPYWRGEIVTRFEVMQDIRGYFVFGDGKSLGTYEGKVTASVPPKNASSQANSPQPTDGKGLPDGKEEAPDNSRSTPRQPLDAPPPATR